MLDCSIFRYLCSVCQIKFHISSECSSRCLQHFVFCTRLKSVLCELLPHNKNFFLIDLSRYLDGQRSHYPLLDISYSWEPNHSWQLYIHRKNMINTHGSGKRFFVCCLFSITFEVLAVLWKHYAISNIVGVLILLGSMFETVKLVIC